MKNLLLLLPILLATIVYAQETPVPEGLKKGDIAPNFTLSTTNGKEITLYGELEKGPIILTFYRGSWCRYCMAQFINLQDSLGLISQKGAQVIAITPEDSEGIAKTIAKSGATFPLLHDTMFETSLKYKTILPAKVEQYAEILKSGEEFRASKFVPIPAAYIIDQNRKIQFVYFDPNYKIRVYVKDLLDNIPKG